MTVQNIYERDLAKTAANFEALTPISFLGRAERVYPDYPALIHARCARAGARLPAVAASLPRPCGFAGSGRGIPSPSLRPISLRCLKLTSGCP